MAQPPEPTRLGEPVWLEPYPDVLLDGLEDRAPGPEARYEAAESISLAFVVSLQHLPPRQRCVLVLRDVLGFRATEVAGMLDTSEAAVKGALQRARESLRPLRADQAADPHGAARPPSGQEREAVERFAEAVEAGDIETVVTLLTDDAWLTMPPEPYEYQGPAAIGRFLDDRARRRGVNLVLVPTQANRQPAFGCYVPDAHTPVAHAYGLLVLTLRDRDISAITWFGDRAVMARFGLPRTLPLR